jgi:hypothetical protein
VVIPAVVGFLDGRGSRNLAGPFRAKPEIINADTCEDLGEGFLRITVNLKRDSAKTVFFLG